MCEGFDMSAIDAEATEVYDLKELQTPRLSGVLARIFLALLESPVLGAILRRKILSDSGFISFLSRCSADGHRLSHPVHPLPPPSSSTSSSLSPEDQVEALTNFHQKISFPASAGTRASIADYASAYTEGRVTPSDVAESVLSAIADDKARQLPLRAIVATNAEALRKEAAASSSRWATGKPLSPLDGVPVCIKDHQHAAGFPTTGGVEFLVGSSADQRDGDCVRTLRDAGALIIGKSHMDELGMGVRGYCSAHGQARNPWDVSRVPGGSSSGGAAAVASGICPVALGSDGGGSIRIPSACCGVHGLKPTYARLSVKGRVFENDGAPPATLAFGPIGMRAADVALCYYVLSKGAPHGAIENFPEFSGAPVDKPFEEVPGDVQGLKIGICKPWFESASKTAVHFASTALDVLQKAGAEIVPVAIPHLEDMRIAHGVTITSATIKGIRKGSAFEPQNWCRMGVDVRGKMRIALEFDEEYIKRAEVLRAKKMAEFVPHLFKKVDVLLTPALGIDVPQTPAGSAETGMVDATADSSLMRFSTFANFLGLPAMTSPVGLDDISGMPYSVQIIGAPWRECTLIRIACFLENSLFDPSKDPAVVYDVLGEALKIKERQKD